MQAEELSLSLTCCGSWLPIPPNQKTFGKIKQLPEVDLLSSTQAGARNWELWPSAPFDRKGWWETAINPATLKPRDEKAELITTRTKPMVMFFIRELGACVALSQDHKQRASMALEMPFLLGMNKETKFIAPLFAEYSFQHSWAGNLTRARGKLGSPPNSPVYSGTWTERTAYGLLCLQSKTSGLPLPGYLVQS